jgi:O-antigen/teichoic acid export membrane protein
MNFISNFIHRRIGHRPNLVKIVHNISWLFFDKILKLGAGFFVGVWIVRYLGPEQFGLFSYVLAFTAIFGSIAKLGLDGIMVRELVNHPEKRDTYLGTAFWLKILGALIAMGLIGTILPFTSNDATTNQFIFIIAAGLVFQSFEVVDFYFESQVLAKIISICKIINLALSSIIKIYLVLTEAELIWFVLVTAFDALSLAVNYFIAYKLTKNQAFYKHFDLSIAKQLLKDSWPMIFSVIIITIYMRIDQIMIKEMLGKHKVGIYSAAVKLIEVYYFLPTLITASLFPAILNAKKISEDLYYDRLQNLYNFMLLIALATASATFFLADWAIELLYGLAYQEAASVLKIYIWASVFIFGSMAASKWIIAENIQFYANYFLIFGLVSNVLLNYILIPQYGIIGAAIATLLSQAIASLIAPAFFRKTRLQFTMLVKSCFLIISKKGIKNVLNIWNHK